MSLQFGRLQLIWLRSGLPGCLVGWPIPLHTEEHGLAEQDARKDFDAQGCGLSRGLVPGFTSHCITLQRDWAAQPACVWYVLPIRLQLFQHWWTLDTVAAKRRQIY